MEKEFKGDYRILRVVLASSEPILTLHRIRTGEYSIGTFLDMMEMLDVKATLEEQEALDFKRRSSNKP